MIVLSHLTLSWAGQTCVQHHYLIQSEVTIFLLEQRAILNTRTGQSLEYTAVATSEEATTLRRLLRVRSGPTGLLRRIMAVKGCCCHNRVWTTGPLSSLIARPHTPPVAPS